MKHKLLLILIATVPFGAVLGGGDSKKQKSKGFFARIADRTSGSNIDQILCGTAVQDPALAVPRGGEPRCEQPGIFERIALNTPASRSVDHLLNCPAECYKGPKVTDEPIDCGPFVTQQKQDIFARIANQTTDCRVAHVLECGDWVPEDSQLLTYVVFDNPATFEYSSLEPVKSKHLVVKDTGASYISSFVFDSDNANYCFASRSEQIEQRQWLDELSLVAEHKTEILPLVPVLGKPDSPLSMPLEDYLALPSDLESLSVADHQKDPESSFLALPPQL